MGSVMNTYTVRDLIRDVRGGSYSSVGCYPLFFLTSDGETMCPPCVKANLWQVGRETRDKSRSDWAIVGHGANWEDPDMFCCHCNKRIESAYAEDEMETV